MRSRWAGTTRGLYLTSMAIFVVTVVIGILNGLDLVDFPHDTLLTHVHAGTLGWIALGIVASAFWMFGTDDRRLAVTLGVLIPIYAAAFFSGNLTARAVTGTAVLAAISWLLVWVWRTYLAGDRTLPRLAVALGLTTFGYGAVIGVVLQIQFASATTILSGDAIGAHAGAMVLNAGLAVFVVGLIAESAAIKRVGSPVMGLAILLALAVLAVRTWSSAGPASAEAEVTPD